MDPSNLETVDLSFLEHFLIIEREEFKAITEQLRMCFLFNSVVGVDTNGVNIEASVFVFNYSKTVHNIPVKAASYYIWCDNRLFKTWLHSHISETLEKLRLRHDYYKDKEKQL